ncbi:outer membrane protein assembly factor BamC [Marinospirillum perlucidum]|uniref:outer membrane protein assembly factor BamC n=1 Tax=Marinospirillum perlucidum TaxID=1982602 RepID=UPI000DF27A02|nr:outer membrane protein assembly factor BamC [Marinospirillum perlucidum]
MTSLPASVPALLLTGLVLAGCSTGDFRDRSEDYHRAEAADYPLPEDYDQQDALPVPEAEGRASGQEAVPRPQPLAVSDAQEEVVTLRTDSDSAWLLVQEAPASVWPTLQQLLEDLDLSVVSSDPRSGEIIWSEGQNLPPQELALRQGIRRGSSEIRVRSLDDGEKLAFSEYDRTRLLTLKNELEVRLGQSGQGVSQQAQALQGDEAVRLVDRDARKVLVLRLDYDRAWSELSYLLEKEFDEDVRKLKDLNRDEGRFYIRFVPREEREQGFFASLFGAGPGPEEHHYQLYLEEYASELDLVLQTEPGQAAPAAVEEEVLRWIEQQLR